MGENFADMKVLVIDDSKTIRRTADTLLSAKGCEVITATDGFDALAKIVVKKPSIIFVDTLMPRLDGYQTCALIKNNDDLKDIPVIMLSRKAGLFDRAKGRIFGADEFLIKPFSNDQLYEAIHHHVLVGSSQFLIRQLTQPATDAVIRTYRLAGGEVKLMKVNKSYQQAITQILKNNKVRENLAIISKLFKIISKICGESPMGYLSALGLELIDGIANGGIRLDRISARLLLSIEGAMRQLVEQGPAGLKNPIDQALFINLLQLFKDASQESKRLTALKERYLEESLGGSGTRAGPDLETIAIVSRFLSEELVVVIDKVDMCSRSLRSNPADVVSLLPDLEKISSTMFLVADGELQQLIMDLLELVRRIQSGNEDYEEGILTMGHSLSEIKASLGLLVGKKNSEEDTFLCLNDSQVTLIRETFSGLTSAKKTVLAYVESEFDHDRLESLLDDLAALTANLVILKQKSAGNILAAAADYVRTRILSGKSMPEERQMDDLADALLSVEYFLKRLLENAGDSSSRLLEVGEAAVEKLGYRIGQKIEPSVEVKGTVGERSGEIEERDEDDLDEEVLEVFIEETLDRGEFFVAESVEEARLGKAISEADRAVTQMERKIQQFNTKNHPSFDE